MHGRPGNTDRPEPHVSRRTVGSPATLNKTKSLTLPVLTSHSPFIIHHSSFIIHHYAKRPGWGGSIIVRSRPIVSNTESIDGPTPTPVRRVRAPFIMTPSFVPFSSVNALTTVSMFCSVKALTTPSAEAAAIPPQNRRGVFKFRFKSVG